MIKRIFKVTVVIIGASMLVSCADYEKGQCVSDEEKVWIDRSGVEGCYNKWEVSELLKNWDTEPESLNS